MHYGFASIMQFKMIIVVGFTYVFKVSIWGFIMYKSNVATTSHVFPRFNRLLQMYVGLW